MAIVTILAGCATTLPPAEPTTQMIDRADRVIIVTDQDQKETYKKIGQYITGEGFQIKNSDPQLQTIQTEFKRFTRGIWSYDMQVSISVRDTAVHFYGQVGNELLSSSDIENRGMNNSQMQNAWERLVELAKGFPHQNIYYARN